MVEDGGRTKLESLRFEAPISPLACAHLLRFLSCPDTSLLLGRSLLDVHVLQNCSLSCHSSEPVGEQCLMEHER